MKKITIRPERVVQWMNVLRSYQHDIPLQYRLLENFWESQIKSKVWLNIIDSYEKIPELYFFR